MDRTRSTHPVTFIVSLLFVAILSPDASASTIWRNDWYRSTTPLFTNSYSNFGYTFSSGFSADGETVFAGVDRSPFNTQVTRLDSAGNLRWVSNLDHFGYQDYTGASAVAATDDGGAFVALGDGLQSIIARVSPDGTLAWSRNGPAKWIAKLQGDRLAARDCSTVSVRNASNGDVLWERKIPQRYYCEFDGLLVDTSSNIYIQHNASDSLHRMKLDADGNLLYDVASGTNSPGQQVRSIAVDATNHYIKAGGDLLAFRNADGALAWSIPSSSWSAGKPTQDATPELVVVGTNLISRLAADTGIVRWSRPLATGGAFEVFGSSIVVNDGDTLMRLNAETGATVWSTTLPAEDDSGHPQRWIDFGGLANNRFTGLASSTSYTRTPIPFVQPIEFSSGALLARAPVPMVAQGANAWTVADENLAVSVAHAMGTSGSELRIRAVDPVGGATVWETVDGFSMAPDYFFPAIWLAPDFAVSDDVVAVVSTLVHPDNNQGPDFSTFQIGLYDRATGANLWKTSIYEPTQTGTYVKTPRIDADGNVYVEVIIRVDCGSSTCAHTRLFKFSRLTGAILWSDDTAGIVFREFEVFGNDIIREGPFQDPDTTLARLSGADGSVVWSSTLFSADEYHHSFYRNDNQHIIFSSASSKAKIDLVTGNVVWTAVNADPACPHPCELVGFVTLPNGDALATGRESTTPFVRYHHNDGSGMVDIWNLTSGNSDVSTRAGNILLTPSLDAMLIIRNSIPSTRVSMNFVGQFDMDTGNLTSQQFLSAMNIDTGSAARTWGMLAWPTANTLFANSESQESPLPGTTGVGKLDTTILANGDLSASLTVDSNVASAGQWIDFHMSLTYAGDQPINSAEILGYLPWQSGLRAVSCSTTNASNCVTDTRFGSIHASLDIQPGGSATIHGQAQISDGTEVRYVGLGVHGPTSLSEPDTINNFSRAKVVQSLFRGDFD